MLLRTWKTQFNSEEAQLSLGYKLIFKEAQEQHIDDVKGLSLDGHNFDPGTCLTQINHVFWYLYPLFVCLIFLENTKMLHVFWSPCFIIKCMIQLNYISAYSIHVLIFSADVVSQYWTIVLFTLFMLRRRHNDIMTLCLPCLRD